MGHFSTEDGEVLRWITQVCWQAAEVKGFHAALPRHGEDLPRDTSATERIMLIVSECAEMMEAIRNDANSDPGSYYLDSMGKPEGVAAELADVMIRCFDYAGCYGIDLGKVIEEKLAYNMRRPMRHGGKTL